MSSVRESGNKNDTKWRPEKRVGPLFLLTFVVGGSVGAALGVGSVASRRIGAGGGGGGGGRRARVGVAGPAGAADGGQQRHQDAGPSEHDRHWSNRKVRLDLFSFVAVALLLGACAWEGETERLFVVSFFFDEFGARCSCINPRGSSFAAVAEGLESSWLSDGTTRTHETRDDEPLAESVRTRTRHRVD